MGAMLKRVTVPVPVFLVMTVMFYILTGNKIDICIHCVIKYFISKMALSTLRKHTTLWLIEKLIDLEADVSSKREYLVGAYPPTNEAVYMRFLSYHHKLYH